MFGKLLIQDIRILFKVEDGEEIRPVVKGPYDVVVSCTRTIVSTYPYAFAIKWAVLEPQNQNLLTNVGEMLQLF